MAFGATPYLGISATPSVHVAMPVMYAPALGSARRRMQLAFAAYAIAILVASVHLGWHYPVDGYVSVAMVLAALGLRKLGSQVPPRRGSAQDAKGPFPRTL